MQLLAAHSAVAAAQGKPEGKFQDASDGAATQMDLIFTRLASLEYLLLDLHWVAIGQYNHCHTSSFFGDGATGTDEAYLAESPTLNDQSICSSKHNVVCGSGLSDSPPSDKKGSDLLAEPSCTISQCATLAPDQDSQDSQQQYCIWNHGSKHTFIKPGSATARELEEEAAIVLQRYFKREFLAVDTSSAEESEATLSEEEDSDDNSAGTVAVRRAYLASISGTTPTRNKDVELWTYERILSWVDGAIDQALEKEDRSAGAMTFWTQWEANIHHFPPSIRKKFVQIMDDKLTAKGFPSLRDLLDF